MEKQYKELQKKYQLPEFKDFDEDFQISSIEAKHFILKEIAKKIVEKMEFFSTILEEILNPERFSGLHESSIFNENEKKNILNIYRRLHFFYRQYSELEVSYNETETAGFVKKIFEEWQIMKPGLKTIVSKMKESWNTNKKSKSELGYFG